MKATVTAMGLPADRVSTHSLRYGGATMLASGGYPEYIIAMYGGWAEGSTSLRRYTRLTSAVIGDVSRSPHAGDATLQRRRRSPRGHDRQGGPGGREKRVSSLEGMGLSVAGDARPPGDARPCPLWPITTFDAL